MKIKNFHLLINLLILITKGNTISRQKVDNNSTLSAQTYETSVVSVEEKLQAELEKVEERQEKWDKWSNWSSCSRSCGGGVSQKIRTCLGVKCRGKSVRYKICNMQSCSDFTDFREKQCASFNKVPLEGQMYSWTVYNDDQNPCSLTCQGTSLKFPNNTVIFKLSDKVQDGTKCREGSLDICINGKCEKVGCDLQIGSSLQIDNCGLCGGDGKSCSQALYNWTLKYTSLCSVACGGGYKMAISICHNRITGDQVEEKLCNVFQKPESNKIACNEQKCPSFFTWKTSEWSTCSSKDCEENSGLRFRSVYCMEEKEKELTEVSQNKCSSAEKPLSEESCNYCLTKWHVSPWSGCSVSCGEGNQIRKVECRDLNNSPSTLCDPLLKPSSSILCSTGIQCPDSFNYENEFTIDTRRSNLPSLPALAEKLITDQIMPSESTFIPGEWEPCSVTCGEGIRRREVHCKIYLEFSKTIAKLPDEQCLGPKPVEVEKCFMESCSLKKELQNVPYKSELPIVIGDTPYASTYSWSVEGFTVCTATCLGGVQELVVKCRRVDVKKEVAPHMCSKETKPQVIVKTCNDHACPPRWNVSDFSPCSHSCGIGIQKREVHCVQDVSQGSENMRIVPSEGCSEPIPLDRQFCNVLDCPVRWKTSPWSKCSKSCGTGEKIRTVECKQVIAQNHTVNKPPSACTGRKPPERMPCNTKSCTLDKDKPVIETKDTTYIQHDKNKDKISLTIGGAATVIAGSTVKIKCPVKRFNRTRIKWKKNNVYLPKIKKYKISKKGALRILAVSLSDDGIYTCVAGKASASLTLNVRSNDQRTRSSTITRNSENKSSRSLHLSNSNQTESNAEPLENIQKLFYVQTNEEDAPKRLFSNKNFDDLLINTFKLGDQERRQNSVGNGSNLTSYHLAFIYIQLIITTLQIAQRM